MIKLFKVNLQFHVIMMLVVFIKLAFWNPSSGMSKPENKLQTIEYSIMNDKERVERVG